MIILNILFAIAWMALNNAYTPVDFVAGLLFGFLVIIVSRRVLTREPLSLQSWFTFSARRNYPLLVWRWAAFIVFGFWSIVKANIVMARIVLSPQLRLQPGIIAIPLDITSEIGITILSNLITLTPGTVALDVSSDRKTLYLHAMDARDPDALRRETKQEFERRVMELLP